MIALVAVVTTAPGLARPAAAEAPGAAAAAPPPSRSHAQQAPPLRVPLDQGFSRLELATTATVVIAGPLLLAFGDRIFGAPEPSLGPPAEGSFDRRWSDRLHLDGGTGARFLARVPDRAGLLVLPYLPGLVYGIDALLIWRGGAARVFPGDPNADHRLVAYAEAIGWTALVTGAVKVLVGRQRPYATLDHPELAGPAREVNLSFFSSHSSAMFSAAAFVALDASRRLGAGPLASASPAMRWLLGTALPYAGAYGLASVVALSRVIDQQHWPSDVLLGALVGATTAHLAYLAHFDGEGQPRRRHSPPASARPAAGGSDLRLVPSPTGIALVGRLP